MATHVSLAWVKHRPWPLPEGKWTWRQSWLDLLFLHYRVDREQLQERLPRGMQVQEFDGSAWVGLVPFRMAGVMRRPWPDMPPLDSFPELNLRTYVEVDGKPGVWFFSLDADCWPIVWGGRNLYGLPYHRADMKQDPTGGGFSFTSSRRDGDARFAVRYAATGDMLSVRDGSFEHWATERYCLYARKGCLPVTRVEVHHRPWPLYGAEVEVTENTVLAAAGISTFPGDPIGLFSPGVDVVSWPPENMG